MDMKGESKIGLGLGLVSDPLYCKLGCIGSERFPVGRSVAKAAVDQERERQTKPTANLGPFFPSSSRPRQLKSIFPPSFTLLSLLDCSPYFLFSR